MTAARSIPACWEHWNLLPEDLQSVLMKTSGRGWLAQYCRHLMKAIKLWRQAGVYRSQTARAPSKPVPVGTVGILATRTLAGFLRLAEQRRTMRRHIMIAAIRERSPVGAELLRRMG